MSLEALVALKDEQDFEQIARGILRLIKFNCTNKLGTEEWNAIINEQIIATNSETSIDLMSKDNLINWITWAYEKGHWRPTPEESIQWAMRRRRHEDH